MDKTFKADEIKFEEAIPAESISFDAPEVQPDMTMLDALKIAGGEAMQTPIPGAVQAQEAITGGASQLSEMADEMGARNFSKVIKWTGDFAAGAVPAKMKDALFLAVAGPLMKGAAALGKYAIGTRPVLAAGDVIGDVAAMIANKSPESLKAIAAKPGAIWTAATKAFSLKHQERLINVIDDGLSKAGKSIGEIEDGFSGFFGTKGAGQAPDVMLRGAFDEIKFKMLKGGYKLPKELAQGLPVPMKGKFDGSSETKYLFEKLAEMKNNPRMSWGDALNLKREINNAITHGIEGTSGLQPVGTDTTRLLKEMVGSINKNLEAGLPPNVRPQWREANKVYSEARDAYSELRKQVIGGKHSGTENQLRLALQRGEYDDVVLRRAQKLGARAEKMFELVRDRLAAQEFKLWAQAGSGSAGKGLGLLGTSFIPSSPRLIGYTTSAAGQTARLVEALGRQAAAHPTISGVGGTLTAQGISNLNK